LKKKKMGRKGLPVRPWYRGGEFGVKAFLLIKKVFTPEKEGGATWLFYSAGRTEKKKSRRPLLIEEKRGALSRRLPGEGTLSWLGGGGAA